MQELAKFVLFLEKESTKAFESKDKARIDTVMGAWKIFQEFMEERVKQK